MGGMLADRDGSGNRKPKPVAPYRPTPWQEQQCEEGPCVEPMFRVYSRLDWVQDLRRAESDTEWVLGEHFGLTMD
jgi:hypothetical protein